MERIGLRISEVAEMLGVSQSMVYDLVARRKLPVIKLIPGKGAVRIRPEDLQDFIENHISNKDVF